MAKPKNVPNLVNELALMRPQFMRERMAALNITGVPCNPCECIISEYLSVSTGNVVITFYTSGITWFDRVHGETALNKVGTVPTPLSVREFMAAFDREEYPELISR